MCHRQKLGWMGDSTSNNTKLWWEFDENIMGIWTTIRHERSLTSWEKTHAYLGGAVEVTYEFNPHKLGYNPYNYALYTV